MSDKVRLEGVVFYGFHGVSKSEQELGQRFLVDLEVERDLGIAGCSDDINDTVSYVDLYKLVKEVMEGPSRHLLENIAETIAQRILDLHQVESVRIEIKKPEVPIKGSVLDHASVEILRRKQK